MGKSIAPSNYDEEFVVPTVGIINKNLASIQNSVSFRLEKCDFDYFHSNFCITNCIHLDYFNINFSKIILSNLTFLIPYFQLSNFLKSPMDCNIVSNVNVNKGNVIISSSSRFVVRFTRENMTSDHSSLVKKIPRISKIARKTIRIEQLL